MHQSIRQSTAHGQTRQQGWVVAEFELIEAEPLEAAATGGTSATCNALVCLRSGGGSCVRPSRSTTRTQWATNRRRESAVRCGRSTSTVSVVVVGQYEAACQRSGSVTVETIAAEVQGPQARG